LVFFSARETGINTSAWFFSFLFSFLRRHFDWLGGKRHFFLNHPIPFFVSQLDKDNSYADSHAGHLPPLARYFFPTFQNNVVAQQQIQDTNIPSVIPSLGIGLAEGGAGGTDTCAAAANICQLPPYLTY
jgi:hypothetical protein